MTTSRVEADVISRTALLDELVKIGERKKAPVKQEKGGITRALAAMGAGAAGMGVGLGLSHVAEKTLPFYNQPHAGRIPASRIILPIVGGMAAMMAERYRQKMNEEYSGTRGFGDRNKKY